MNLEFITLHFTLVVNTLLVFRKPWHRHVIHTTAVNVMNCGEFVLDLTSAKGTKLASSQLVCAVRSLHEKLFSLPLFDSEAQRQPKVRITIWHIDGH